MASQEKAEKNWSLIVPGVLLIFFGALCVRSILASRF